MKAYLWVGSAILVSGAASLSGQTTTINLSRQAKVESGSNLPQHCRAGQLFLQTTASGRSLNYCASDDIWTPVGSSYVAGDGVSILGTTIAVEDALVPMYYTGAGAPSIACMAGRDFYVNTTDDGLYFCKSTGWQAVSLPGHTHAAGDLVSGTVAASRLPATVLYGGQGNSFGAGYRQSVGHDSANAGLRLMPAAGDPSGVQNGDLWYNSTTGKFRRYQNGSAMDWDVSGAVFLNQSNNFALGQRQSVGHDSTNAGLRLIPAVGDPSSALDGDLWYNTTTGKFRRRQNGVTSDWDASGGAFTTQANTYTAGQKQSMSHDGTNAGFRLIPAAGDPSSAQDGDLWYSTTTGKFRRRQSGVTSDWDASGGAFTTQANTYTAGQKQSMSHDGTNAGLRLIPAAGDPSSAQDGDLWYSTTTGKFRRRQSGVTSDWDASGGSSTGECDPTHFCLVDEFTFKGAFSSANFGLYGWYGTPVGGGCGYVSYAGNALANHPGLVTWTTPAAANQGCVAALDAGNNQTILPSLAGSVWQAQWTMIPQSTLSASNFVLRAGLGTNMSTVGSMSGILTRVDPDTTANIQFDLYTSGAVTATLDSGLAYDSNATSYTFKWRGDAAKFYWSVSKNGAAFSTEKTLCPAGCDMTAALPTFGTSPALSLVHGATSDSAQKRFLIDRFSMDIGGLSR